MSATLKSFAADDMRRRGTQPHLVHYLPHGCEAHVCATVWQECGQARLASPFMPRRGASADRQRLGRQFSDGIACRELLEDVMSWLDAACYAATGCDQVLQACHEHPEWDLRCEPFDGSDTALVALNRLMRAASEDAALPPVLVRECARIAVQRLLGSERRLAGSRLLPIRTDVADDLVVVELLSGARVLVSVRHQVRPTQAASLGVVAHYRMAAMAEGDAPVDRCLLILPDLDLVRPMTMTPRAAIANLDPTVLRDALLRLAATSRPPSAASSA